MYTETAIKYTYIRGRLVCMHRLQLWKVAPISFIGVNVMKTTHISVFMTDLSTVGVVTVVVKCASLLPTYRLVDLFK